MKVLASHRYFWPDTAPYAHILKEVGVQWVSDGHKVTVLSSQPSYKQGFEVSSRDKHEVIDGVLVKRLNLPHESGRPLIRILNTTRICIRLVYEAVIGQYDVIMTSTYPPVVMGFCGALAAKLTGARFIYHCMDIHPELGRISGDFRGRLLYRLLRHMDEWSCSVADPVIVLSADMQDVIANRRPSNKLSSLVLNNFSLQASGDNVELPFAWPAADFVILFAGNIGRFQGLNVVIEAMCLLSARDDIHLLLIGDGSEKSRLQKISQARKANITFVEHQPLNVVKTAMRRAGAGLVCLLPGVSDYAYPSKVSVYLEQACPILACVDVRSTLAADLQIHNLGVSAGNTKPEAIASAIEDWSERVGEYKFKQSINAYLNVNNKEKLLRYWSNLLGGGVN